MRWRSKPNAYSYCNSYSDGYVYSYSDGNGNGNSYGNGNGNSYGYSYGHANSDGNSPAEDFTDAAAVPNAASTPISSSA